MRPSAVAGIGRDHGAVVYTDAAPLVRVAMAGVLVLASVLYLTALGTAPVNVGSDEARFAVQAHSIATTGRDINGTRMPLFFHLTTTRRAGVFVLPIAVLLPCGIWSIWTRDYSIARAVLVIGFFFAPVPIVAALPQDPRYATPRDLLAMPFGVRSASPASTG
jgi:hypothetical protein